MYERCLDQRLQILEVVFFGKTIDHIARDLIDIAHGQGDLDVTAIIEVLDRHDKRLEGFTPQLIDALIAVTVPDQLAVFEGFLQAFAADTAQFVTRFDLDAAGFHFHQLVEDIGRAVKQGTG